VGEYMEQLTDDYYEFIGVSRNADEKEIQVAWRKLVAKYHPDRNKSEHAEHVTQYLNKIRDVLIEPKKRKQYDETLKNDEAYRQREEQYRQKKEKERKEEEIRARENEIKREREQREQKEKEEAEEIKKEQRKQKEKEQKEKDEFEAFEANIKREQYRKATEKRYKKEERNKKVKNLLASCGDVYTNIIKSIESNTKRKRVTRKKYNTKTTKPPITLNMILFIIIVMSFFATFNSDATITTLENNSKTAFKLFENNTKTIDSPQNISEKKKIVSLEEASNKKTTQQPNIDELKENIKKELKDEEELKESIKKELKEELQKEQAAQQVQPIQSTQPTTEVKAPEVINQQTKLTEKPTCSFYASATTGNAPFSTTFYSQTTGTPNEYFWVFEPTSSDDWNSHHPITASHTFKRAGVYTVSLTCTNEAGSTTAVKEAYIIVN
jgi:curved DNA-binding protein CbpA